MPKMTLFVDTVSLPDEDLVGACLHEVATGPEDFPNKVELEIDKWEPPDQPAKPSSHQ